MKRTARLGLVLTPQEKTAVIRLAESAGGLSQAALVRSLIRIAAHEQGIWSQRRVSVPENVPVLAE